MSPELSSFVGIAVGFIFRVVVAIGQYKMQEQQKAELHQRLKVLKVMGQFLYHSGILNGENLFSSVTP